MTDILGEIIKVDGASCTARVNLGSFGEAAEHKSDPAVQARVGELVKFQTPGSNVFGIVNGLAVTEYSARDGSRIGEMVIDIIGEVRSRDDAGSESFQRGVSIFPALGAKVVSVDSIDINLVYAQPKKFSINVGTIHQMEDTPAHFVVDDLLNKHFAILGTTGSGKSCAVTLVLRAMLEELPNAHIVMMDPHDEYSAAFGDLAEVINIDNLQLPYWLLNFEELQKVLVSQTTTAREAELRILRDAVLKAKKENPENRHLAGYITIDTPISYRLSALKKNIDDEMGTLTKAEGTAPYLRLLTKIDLMMHDKRYEFMFSSLLARDIMPEILSRILRIPTNNKPITIIDLSGLPSEVTDVVVSVMCRSTFDFALWNEDSQSVPILFVCEEAHRYVPNTSSEGFEPTKKAIEQIAKEGRKYGVSLCLITQRPSELSPSILSQCGTILALRMNNEQDLDYVRSALPEGAEGLLTVLAALHTQEGIVVGEAVNVPMRIKLGDLAPEHQPQSKSASFSTAWKNDTANFDMVSKAVLRWRQQKRRGAVTDAPKAPPGSLAPPDTPDTPDTLAPQGPQAGTGSIRRKAPSGTFGTN